MNPLEQLPKGSGAETAFTFMVSLHGPWLTPLLIKPTCFDKEGVKLLYTPSPDCGVSKFYSTFQGVPVTPSLIRKEDCKANTDKDSESCGVYGATVYKWVSDGGVYNKLNRKHQTVLRRFKALINTHDSIVFYDKDSQTLHAVLDYRSIRAYHHMPSRDGIRVCSDAVDECDDGTTWSQDKASFTFIIVNTIIEHLDSDCVLLGYSCGRYHNCVKDWVIKSTNNRYWSSVFDSDSDENEVVPESLGLEDTVDAAPVTSDWMSLLPDASVLPEPSVIGTVNNDNEAIVLTVL